MTMKKKEQTLWILPDEAKVIRYSELLAIYEQEGSYRTTALAIGSNATTVMRALREAGLITKHDKDITKLNDRISELEAQLKNGKGV